MRFKTRFKRGSIVSLPTPLKAVYGLAVRSYGYTKLVKRYAETQANSAMIYNKNYYSRYKIIISPTFQHRPKNYRLTIYSYRKTIKKICCTLHK